MPNQPKSTARTIRADDPLWADVRDAATYRGEDVSEMTRRLWRREIKAVETAKRQASASVGDVPRGC